jgi:hypothetical protein
MLPNIHKEFQMPTFAKISTLIVALSMFACNGEGADGVNGKDGAAINGTDGAPGAQGPAGRDGTNGRDGVDGKPGLDGAPGVQGPAGATGEKGERGDAGPVGPMGPMGPQGAIGPSGPQGVPGPQGAQGVAGPKGDPGSFMSATVLTCSQQSKVSYSGRVIVRYWAKLDDAKITPNSIALASAHICGRTTAPMGQDICRQQGVTCQGDPNPWPDCQTTPVNIEQGRIWVSCGTQDQLNGEDIGTDKFATAHIMYKIGG